MTLHRMARPEEQDPAFYLSALERTQRLRDQRVPGVRTVLVVLSSRGMVYDMESLRQHILLAYPDAAVFFRNTAGKAQGAPSPKQVDLLLDFTGPGQRQWFLFPRKLRKMARFAVGRNAGIFRARLYDRIFDENALDQSDPAQILDRERKVQTEVLALAGVPMVPAGNPTADRAKTIALELPPLAAH